MSQRECLNAGPDCAGEVEWREPLSWTGRSYARCEHHWEERLRSQEQINRRYPESQPSDFDPSYAGERWDSDY